MNNFTEAEIIEFYIQETNFTLQNRIIFLMTSFCMAMGFLSLRFPPLSSGVAFGLAFVAVFIWVVIAVPKTFKAQKALRAKKIALMQNPLLLMKCSFYAVKPTQSEQKSYPFLLPLFYLALVIPFIGFSWE